MPCSREAAQKLIRRLRSLPFAGDAEDAAGSRQEVGQALMTHASDDAHAGRIVDALMDRLRAFPVRADVVELAANTRSAAEEYYDPVERWGPKPELCDSCRGLGMVKGVDGFVACHCPDVAPPELVASFNAKFLKRGTA